jgi:hypothetical protein
MTVALRRQSGRGRAGFQRLVPALVAVAVLAGLAAAPASPLVPPTSAATDLTMIGATTYQVVPEEARIRVTVDLVATNHLRDTTTRRFYFDRGFLTVQPGTTNFKITSETGDPTVRVSQKRGTHQTLALGFGQRIAAGKSARFRLTYDLPDPGGAATREVRVGEALVSFPAWGHGYPNGIAGGTVRVIFPAGYTVNLEAGEMPAPTTDDTGRIVYTTPKLDDTTAYFAFFVADRPGSYATTRRTADVRGDDAQLSIRAWPDDPDWAARVGGLFERGLPEMGNLIGLPWPLDEPLIVQEAVSRSTGGYAGRFDPAASTIEVAYYADSFVVLHEAAHTWFNGSLLADRWATEAFASYYAVAAGGRIEEPLTADELTEELLAARIPLNAWGRAAIPEATDRATDDYGYAASLALAREIAALAGFDGLRRVWAAAAAGETAYQPPNVDAGPSRAPETGAGPPDWRGLLDLLEEHTNATYVALWTEWVVRDDEAELLEARDEARTTYAAVLRSAGRWELPRSIRDAMRAWQFEDAMTLLADAQALLDRRVLLEEQAAAARLTLPTRLELAFESDAGFEIANSEADAEAAAMDLLADAAAARPTSPDLLQQIGLYQATPDADLAAARSAFARGDLEDAARGAVTAEQAWLVATDLGRSRLLTGIGVAILAVLGILLLVSFVLGRRAARRQRRLAVVTRELPPAGDPGPG